MLADRLRNERVSRITGILNTQHAALVDETVDLLANEREWVGPGVWTIESYLQWRAGVSISTARQLSSIARRVNDLPTCLAAFRRGELTLDQMATIARRAPGWIDTQIHGLAVTLTVNQLTRVLRDYPFPTFDTDGNEITHRPIDDDTTRHSEPNDADASGMPGAADEPIADTPTVAATSDSPTGQAVPLQMVEEYCSFAFGDDGVFRMRVATDYETGSTIAAALNEALDRLFRSGRDTVTMIDALRAVAAASLDTVDDSARAARFTTSIVLDVNATATDTTHWTVPDAIRRHITCDGLLTPVFVDNGIPISVGRSQRIVPDRTRTIIEHRDHGCCTVPGCTRTVGLDVHHIIHWEHDGNTDTSNLLLICSHHHRQHHRGLLGITGNADLATNTPGAIEFTDRTGRRIQPSGASPLPPIGPIAPPDAPYHHPLGERLHTETIVFNPPTAPAPTATPHDTAHRDTAHRDTAA